MHDAKTIREAIDAIVTHARSARHSERRYCPVAVDRTAAKPALSDAEGESRAGQSVARRIGGIAHP